MRVGPLLSHDIENHQVFHHMSLFRIDGSGDEYAGGVCRGFDFGGVEEGGGGEKAGGLTPN